jgi:hypothetical protein
MHQSYPFKATLAYVYRNRFFYLTTMVQSDRQFPHFFTPLFLAAECIDLIRLLSLQVFVALDNCRQ